MKNAVWTILQKSQLIVYFFKVASPYQ